MMVINSNLRYYVMTSDGSVELRRTREVIQGLGVVVFPLMFEDQKNLLLCCNTRKMPNLDATIAQIESLPGVMKVVACPRGESVTWDHT